MVPPTPPCQSSLLPSQTQVVALGVLLVFGVGNTVLVLAEFSLAHAVTTDGDGKSPEYKRNCPECRARNTVDRTHGEYCGEPPVRWGR